MARKSRKFNLGCSFRTNNINTINIAYNYRRRFNKWDYSDILPSFLPNLQFSDWQKFLRYPPFFLFRMFLTIILVNVSDCYKDKRADTGVDTRYLVNLRAITKTKLIRQMIVLCIFAYSQTLRFCLYTSSYCTIQIELTLKLTSTSLSSLLFFFYL